jgi:S-adenosyl-L-methionine hydrolase (adenosine-forming)
MGRRYDTVTFLTDYGVVDEFAGVVRSVIRDIAPHVTVIDLTHGIRPFDVRGGSLALARSIGYVASGVVLAVVDPGVGSTRRAVAIQVAGGEGILIGPDNGLLAPAVAMVGGAECAVELTNTEFQIASPSATFAGRDVFGPAAAHLCNGVDLMELGTEIDVDLLMPGIVPLAQVDDEIIIAQVLWVDQFGNVQLNVGPADLPPAFGDHISVRMDAATRMSGASSRSARRALSFSDLAGGAIGLVVDSSGLLALAMDQRSAAEELGLDVGDQVTLSADERSDPTDGVTQSVTIRPH